MRKSGRLLTGFMALCLSLCLGTAAFAAETGPADTASVTITKVYRMEGSGTSPAETFMLRQVGDGIVKDGEAASAPALGTITGAAFTEGEAAAQGAEEVFTVELPEYERVGVYEYMLEEIGGTNAGVTYYGDKIRLVVTVINDSESGKLRIAAVHTETTKGTKSDRITGTYSAGTLDITKTVTGNLGDKTKYFKFTVTLTGREGLTYGEGCAVTGGSYETNPSVIRVGEPADFYLKHDETLSIANIPYGTAYTVTEETPEDYVLTSEGASGTIAGAETEASFVNEKGGTPDTGIDLDQAPYILILAAAVIGIAVAVYRRLSMKLRRK